MKEKLASLLLREDVVTLAELLLVAQVAGLKTATLVDIAYARLEEQAAKDLIEEALAL